MHFNLFGKRFKERLVYSSVEEPEHATRARLGTVVVALSFAIERSGGEDGQDGGVENLSRDC